MRRISELKAIGEGEVDDPVNGPEGDGGFGPIPGQGIKSFSPAPRQNHGQDLLHGSFLLSKAPGSSF